MSEPEKSRHMFTTAHRVLRTMPVLLASCVMANALAGTNPVWPPIKMVDRAGPKDLTLATLAEAMHHVSASSESFAKRFAAKTGLSFAKRMNDWDGTYYETSPMVLSDGSRVSKIKISMPKPGGDYGPGISVAVDLEPCMDARQLASPYGDFKIQGFPAPAPSSPGSDATPRKTYMRGAYYWIGKPSFSVNIAQEYKSPIDCVERLDAQY